MKIAILTTDNREHFGRYTEPVPHFGTAPEALLEGFSLLDDVEVHVLSCTRKPVEAPEKIAPNIWYHSLRVPKAGWMFTGYQGCIRAVREKLREIGPDIVHGQGTERDCAVSAVFSGFPNVLTIHGNMAEINRLFPADSPWLRGYQTLTMLLENACLKRTAGVFCNSAYTEGLIAPRARKTWRVPNPVRPVFFDPPAPAAPTRWERPLVNIGVLSPRKRQLELLRVAKELYAEGFSGPLLFIGGHPKKSPYEMAFAEELREAEAAGYAFHLGTMNATALLGTLDQAGALLHFPSEESFGLVIAEALARNLKCFGASLGGIVDIASGAEGAELYAQDNWAGLKEGIKAWMEAKRPRPTTTAALMAERYHPRQVARRHLEIYQEVLSKAS